MIVNLKNIDFKKYKRFFAFGCSFTGYIWPTWAEVLASEMPNAEFYNFGHCGGGNSMMSNRIVETNCRYKFTETDLVVPMWTTFCREDRFKYGSWMRVGNIFTQQEYSQEFVREYADPKGYLLRDLAIITSTTHYLKTIDTDSFTMSGVPYDYQMDKKDHLKPTVNEILEVYKDTINLTPPALIDLELGGNFKWGHEYIRQHNKELYKDYHPHTLNYYGYLKKIGLPLTNNSLEYANKVMELMSTIKKEEEFEIVFNSMHVDRNNKLKSIF